MVINLSYEVFLGVMELVLGALKNLGANEAYYFIAVERRQRIVLRGNG